MPRLTKQNAAARTAKMKKMQGVSSTAVPYSIDDNEREFITQEKIDVLNLPYKYIMWLGAKDGGKTRPVVTRMTGIISTDDSSYGLSLKKYKTNAASRLHTATANMAREMRMKGYDIPMLQKGITNSYFMKDPKFKDNNQTIEYASLDDMDGIAGIEAPNLGKFALVHIEEPVMKGDKEQPDHDEFWETIAVLESSVNRSNRRYAEINGEEPTYPSYHFTMNAWDDHPIVIEAEKVFPENDFLNSCLGVDDWQNMSLEEIDENWNDMRKSLIKNHTKAVSVKSEGKAFVRLTMFANPSWPTSELVYNSKLESSREEQEEVFWLKIKQSIIEKDYSALAIYLGLKKQKSNDNKTYQMSMLQVGDVVKEIKEGNWKVLGSSQGWDVDINRLFVNSGVIFAERNTVERGKEYKLFVLPQKTFSASGSGGGRNIPIYRDKMIEITNNRAGEFVMLQDDVSKRNQYGDYLYIDDNQGQWLQYFLDLHWFTKGKAKKHGPWDILKRQAWMNQAINSGFIMIDEANVDLIHEMKISTLSKGSDKRDESSTLNKNYDRLNSLEYAIYPFHHWINEFVRSA